MKQKYLYGLFIAFTLLVIFPLTVMASNTCSPSSVAGIYSADDTALFGGPPSYDYPFKAFYADGNYTETFSLQLAGINKSGTNADVYGTWHCNSDGNIVLTRFVVDLGGVPGQPTGKMNVIGYRRVTQIMQPSYDQNGNVISVVAIKAVYAVIPVGSDLFDPTAGTVVHPTLTGIVYTRIKTFESDFLR